MDTDDSDIMSNTPDIKTPSPAGCPSDEVVQYYEYLDRLSKGLQVEVAKAPINKSRYTAMLQSVESSETVSLPMWMPPSTE